jgi:putative N6-adenine-specific DNA methylase
VVCNPPYGHRLGAQRRLIALYRTLGRTLVTRFRGWRCAILTSDARLLQATRLKPQAEHALRNGGLKVTLGIFQIA